MTLSALLASNTANFHNLALFICHLFIDGQFRTGHLLHDPKAFQIGQLIIEIESNCPRSIPWLSNDVTVPSLAQLLWKPEERTDHILQLIFFDPNDIPKNFDDFNEFLTFYRLIVFSSSNQLKINEQILTIIKSNTKSVHVPGSIILSTSENGYIRLQWIEGEFEDTKNESSIKTKDLINTFYKQNAETNFEKENLFDRTFPKYEENSLMAINHAMGVPCNLSRKLNRVSEIRDGQAFFANFYLAKLNASYINLKVRSCINFTLIVVNRMVKPKSQRFYKELSTEYETIAKEKVKQKFIHLDFDAQLPSFSISIYNEKSHALYSYRHTKLIVIFVYGSDFKRQKHHVLSNETTNFTLRYSLINVVLSAMLLCYLRRRNHLRRDGYISCIIDVIIVHVGGGNLRLHHQLERFIMGFYFVGSFFFAVMFFDAILIQYFFVQDDTIETFKELAKIMPPFFIGSPDSTDVILDRLKKIFGADVRYEGAQLLIELLRGHKKSFGFIVKETVVGRIKTAAKNVRDLDVLKENLGTVDQALNLKSNQYISNRMIDRTNKVTSSILENGIFEFYKSFGRFLEEIRGHKATDGEFNKNHFKSLSMEQAMPLFKLYVIFLICSSAAIVVEIIIHKSYKWLSQRIRQICNLR